MSPADPAALPPYTGTLTPEHLAVVNSERDRWLRIGLSTTPADRPAAEAAVRRAYQAAGLQPPSVVVWLDSPLGGCLATAVIRQLRDQLWCQLRDQLDAQLVGQLEGQLEGQLWCQLRDQLDVQLEGQPDDRLDDQLGEQRYDRLDIRLGSELDDQLEDQLKAKLGNRLLRQLEAQLWEQLEEQLQGQLEAQLEDQLRRELASRRGGQHRHWLMDQLAVQFNHWSDAYWLACKCCARRVAGLPPSLRLEALADAVARLGWWWPRRGAVVLTDRPTVVARDDQGRLHTEAGPALAWADGFSLHAIHGVRVPAHVVQAPQTITVEQIREERNQEVRRVMLDRYGHARFLRDADAERVHADQVGILWRCQLPGEEPLMLVEVINATPEADGSARTYWLRVPPDVRTARQAVAWTFGLDEHDYHPEAQT
jgi:hypothetical protein